MKRFALLALWTSAFLCLALKTDAATFRWASTSNRIYVEGGGTVTLSDIKAGLNIAPLDLLDAGNKIWLLRANIFLTDGSRLNLHGASIGGDVNELRLQSTNALNVNSIVSIIAEAGEIHIESTKVTSWNTPFSAPDTEYATYGRAFLRVRSKLAANGITPLESRMDIINSEICYLGYDAAESYGLVWKVLGSTAIIPNLYDLVQVRGDVINCVIHHNYFGLYTYGAQDCQFLNNEVHSNVKYGFDPHDDSDNLLIEGNNSHHNGDHGIIASRRCDHIVIRNNYSWANAGNGIMLHRHCNDGLIENNHSYLNEDSGVSLFDNDRTLVRNNICLSNMNAGIRISAGAADNIVENNEFGYSEKYGVYFYSGSDPAEPDPDDPTVSNRLRRNKIRNNIFYHSGSDGAKVGDADDSEFEGNTFASDNPLLRFSTSTGTKFINNSLPSNVTVKLIGSSSVGTTIAVKDQLLARFELDQYSSVSYSDVDGAVFDLSENLFTSSTALGSTLNFTTAQVGGDTTVTTRDLFALPTAGTIQLEPLLWKTTGDLAKEWKAQATAPASPVNFRVGDLTPGDTYGVLQNGALLNVFAADALGVITFSLTPGTAALATYRVEPREPPPNQQPLVALTAPANGASIVAGTTVTVSADASDPDGSVAQVQFFADDVSLGTFSSGPYSLTWTPPAGVYVLTAVATDNLGLPSTSVPVTLTVTTPLNQPPIVQLTSPIDGLSVLVGTPIDIIAEASDGDGSVAQVEFFDGSISLATLSSSPHSINWTPSVGIHDLTAVATDNLGLTSTSAVVTVTVTAPPNQPPIVQLTAPVNGLSVLAGTHIDVIAEASDTGGSVAHVEFFDGIVSLASLNSSPYSINRTLSVGLHDLTAVATDNLGLTSTSAVVTVTVTTPPNQLPLIQLTSPVDGLSILEGTLINLDAEASDPDGTIVEVAFYTNGVLLVAATLPPYSNEWTPVAGTYELVAVAKDNALGTSTSAPVILTITSPPINIPPTAELVTPLNGASIIEGASYSISATAIDSDGTIAQVALYTNGVLLTILVDVPYLYDWPPALGTYELVAVATDNLSAKGTSAPVSVTVTAPLNQLPTVQLISPVSGTVSAGTLLSVVANASDPDGTIAKVAFYTNDVLFQTITSAPFSFDWTPAPGSYEIVAVATDNLFGTATSASVTVIVSPPPNQLPFVTITSPPTGSTFPAGSLITFSADATDPDGTVTRVEFFTNGVSMNVVLVAPFSFTRTAIQGTYSVVAVATDNVLATAPSAPVLFTVTAPPNQPPFVQITTPANGGSATAGATIDITANASDPDGAVAEVAFYTNSVLLATVSTVPSTYAWAPAPGNYSITAVAKDNLNLTTTSAPVTFTVNPAGPSAFLATGGLVVMEAEHYTTTTTASAHSWIATTARPGFVGASAMFSSPNNGTTISANIPTTSPLLSYRVQFNTAGNYNLWIRGWAASGSDDSVNVAIDNQTPQSISYGATGAWIWRSKQLTISTPGIHFVNVWMREDGAYVDRVLLNSILTFTPTGDGPTESAQTGGGGGPPPNVPPTVQLTAPANGTTFPAGSLIALEATASDSDGSIAQVAFYANGSEFAVDTGSPFAASWTPAGGSYSIAAVAKDNAGAFTTSSIANVVITSSSPSGTFLESGGLLAIEAEHFESNLPGSGHAWNSSIAIAGFAGESALQSAPNSGLTISANIPSTSPALTYRAQFLTPGTYNFWVRGWAASGSDDSIYIGLNNQSMQTISYAGTGAWGWKAKQVSITTPGVYVLNVWMREDGAYVDRLVLSSNPAFVPTGLGPAESAH